MKKHNLLKTVMIVMAIVIVMSWILPISYFFGQTYSLVQEDRMPIGIFHILYYMKIAIQYFGHIAVYVLAVGGLYGVLHQISGYRNLLDKIAKGFRDHEWIFMCIIMVLFAVLSAMAGISMPLLALFPMVISIILLMGYDKITATMVTAGATVVGLIGSVFSENNTYGIDIVINSNPSGQVLNKILLLGIALVLLIVNVLVYAKKHKNKKEEESSDYVPLSKDKKEKVWPIVVIMDAVLVVLVLAFLSWNLFGIQLFDKILNKLNGSVFGKGVSGTVYNIVGSFIGLQNGLSFGYWTLTEAAVVVILASFLIALAYRMKFNDYLTNFISGAKRAFKPAALVVLIYTILIMTSSVPNLMYIFKPVLTLTSSFNAFTMSLVAFVYSVFSVDLYYAATTVLPYVSLELYTNLAQNASQVNLLALVWQSMYGVAMLVAPTSVIVMTTLAYLHIPFGKWLKSIWKLFVELIVVILIIFAILTLVFV